MASVDYTDCSDGSEEIDEVGDRGDGALLRALRDGEAQDGAGIYTGYDIDWMFAMRKYVRKDDAQRLAGLLAQERIHLQCRPCVNEMYNNDPTDLDLQVHDGFHSAVSVRNFIECGGPNCQALVAGVADDKWSSGEAGKEET